MANKFALKYKARSLILGKKTIVMGVLNVTPDSFSDGGLYYKNVKKSAERSMQMCQEGADIIDVGGESTRPGSEPISISEEVKRVIPVIKEIRRILPNIFISIDSYKAEVVTIALSKGADMVNSLGGFLFDKKLAEVVRDFKTPIIIYHIKGKPKDMQVGKQKYNDVVKDIMDFLKDQIRIGESFGIKREQFLIDPGIGFGKTIEQNLEIIKRLKEFSVLGRPIVIGASRKSHLGQILKDELKLSIVPSPPERLEASLAETAVVVLNSANIIRTHDILQTKKFLVVLDRLK